MSYAPGSSVIQRTNIERDAYFRSHKCSLGDLHTKYRIQCGWIRRFILNLTAVNVNDIRARSMFKSYAGLCEERQRQFHQHPLAIHPFSKLRFWAEVIVGLSLVVTNCLLPVWIASENPTIDDPLHKVISAFELLYVLINVPINILTGYVDGKNKQNIVLDKYRIIKKYFCTWMAIDVMALISVVFDYVHDHQGKGSIMYLKMKPIGVLQLFVLFNYEQNICQVLKMGVPSRTAVELVLFLTNYLTWNIVFQFSVEYAMEDNYHPEQPRNCSWLTIGQLWDKTWEVRLLYGLTRAGKILAARCRIVFCFVWVPGAMPVWCHLFRTVTLSSHHAETAVQILTNFGAGITTHPEMVDGGMVILVRFFFILVGMMRKNSNYNLLQDDGCFEIFFVIAWVIAQVLILHCSFKYMLALLGSQSAKSKYYIMSQQVQAYMDQKRFPPRIKKKILKFYAIRFQSHFFVESTMMDCVSGQLREDIIMHTGRQLVREVTFLKQLPRAVLIQLSLLFKLVICIEGDIIIKIHTIGDRMYFIHKGTVAFYSESGCEIMHMEDGDYFGEAALVTKHKNRFATVVAVTNCELFSLSRESFQLIECYPTVFDELKKAAIRKMERVRVLDQQYKDQLKH